MIISARRDLLVAAGTFIVLYAVLMAISPPERNSFSANNLAVLVTTLAIAAAGTTLVMITGGFDLSVAGVVSLANVLAATWMSDTSVWTVAALILVLGAAVGLVNGILVVAVGLQSLAATLGTYIALTGVALVILPAPGGQVPFEFAGNLTRQVGPVPVAVLLLIVLGALGSHFLRTRAGVAAFALGADKEAARMSGIRVVPVEIGCYTLAGLLYALAGLYLSAVTASGDANSGKPFLLTAFAAMALGLISFRGGRGSIPAAMFGAATLTVIPKILFAAGVEDFWVGACQGLVILLALGLTPLAERMFRQLARTPVPTAEVAQ